jgi:hypothetical protein
MLAQLSPLSRVKRTNKAACFGLEAIMAIWMSNKLPGMSYKEGRCFNDAICGYWGCRDIYKNLTYVSFEKVQGDFLPIMVHPDIRHIKQTYGHNGLFSSSMIVKTPFLSHVRLKKVFLKAFKSYQDEEVLELLFQQAEERGGEEISYKLRKEVDLKNASPGVFVSKNGKFREQGGVLGVDYSSHPSITSAIREKVINNNWGSRPNQRKVTLQLVRENMDERGECFIPWSRGGLIPGKKGNGTLVKFDGYMHARAGRDDAVGCVYPSEEI